MDIAEESQEGVISSNYPDLDLPISNIWSFLYPRYQLYSNLTAFISSTTSDSYTYQDLVESSLRFAKELEKYVEYNSGDAVAVIMPNNIEYPIVELGAFAVGAAVCLIRNDFQPDIALDILKDVKPKVLVIDSTLVEKFKIMFDKLPKLKIFVRGSNEKFTEGEDLHSVIYSKSEGMPVEKALKIDPELVAVVTCSSGTTGKPKAIILTHRSMVTVTQIMSNEEICYVKKAEDGFQDSMLANLPYAHIYSLYCYTLSATALGCRIVELIADDLTALVDVVHKYKTKVLTFRAYMVDELIKMDGVKEKLSSVEIISNVGCPLNPKSAEQLKKIIGKDIFVVDCYGASEMGHILACPLTNECIGATGKLLSNIKVRVVDVESGRPILKPFTQGELQVLTPGIMKGYFNNPEATKEAFDGKWFRTGDVCYFDDNYAFYVIERFKDLISFRGKKIFPTDLENIIRKHDGVIDAGVTGVPDPISREEIPKAFVRRNRQVSEEEIIDFVKKNTSKEEMWLGLKVTFVDSLPRNHLGKMVRKVLREMDWSKSSTF